MNSRTLFLARNVRFSSPLVAAIVLAGARLASAQEEPPAAAAEEPPSEGSGAPSSEGSADASASAEAPSEPPPLADTSGGASLFESSGSGAAAASVGDLTFELGGYVRGDAFVGVLHNTSEPAINAAYGELSFQPKVKKGDWGSAFADLRLRYGQQLTEQDLFVDLREAYVNAYFGPVDVRVGKQVIVWGRALGINPTNNLSAVDFRIRSPVEDDKRIGNFATRINVNLNPVRIEGVWQPLYQPTLLPDVELDPAVSFVDPNYPAVSLRNGNFAGKVQLETSAFEGSLSYLNGNAPLPGLAYVNHKTATSMADTSYWVQIQRASYRQHVVGMDFAAVVGELFGVRGEAAFRSPINPGGTVLWAAKPDVQYVLGLDREFGNVMVIAQYLGRYTLNWEDKRPEIEGGIGLLGSLNPMYIEHTDPNGVGYNPQVREANTGRINDVLFNNNRMLFNQLRQVQHLASLRVEWKTMQERLSLSATGLVNFSTQEWALFPKLTYQITGGISTALGGEIYMGPDGTLFGLISDRLTAGYAELRMTF